MGDLGADSFWVCWRLGEFLENYVRGMMWAEVERVRRILRGRRRSGVYLLLIDGNIKIGWASDVRRRVGRHRSTAPTLSPLAVIPSKDPEEERRVHRRLVKHAVRFEGNFVREFFKDCRDTRRVVNAAVPYETWLSTPSEFDDPIPSDPPSYDDRSAVVFGRRVGR